jgi:hypothetical protein
MSLLFTFESNAAMLANSGWTVKILFGRSQKKDDFFWANYDASNPVESSGIVRKNFPFDLRSVESGDSVSTS